MPGSKVSTIRRILTNGTNDFQRVYNRGFWEGYYMGSKFGEWTEDYGNQATEKKVYIGKVTNYFGKIGRSRNKN